MGILKPEDIYIQNDFYDDVVNDPAKYNNPTEFSVLYDVSTRHIKGYTILDYLLLNSVENQYFSIFITNLKNNDLYDGYVEFTINNNNDLFF